MEGVDHVHIVEVGSGCLIGDVNWVLQWQTPYGEGLKLCISGSHTSFVLIVKLRETCCHLTASRTRGRNDYKRTGSLYEVVLSESLVAGNELHVVWIAVDRVVDIRLYSHSLQTVTELIGSVLTVIVGDDDASHHEAAVHKLIAQSQCVFVVCDAEVGSYLVLLDVFGIHHDDNLDAVSQLCQHAQL